MPSSREAVNAPGAPAAVGPYVHAVKASGLLFCSGQIPLDPGDRRAGRRDARRADQAGAWRTCRRSAPRAGTDLSQAVKLNVYLTDMGAFAEVNDVYATFFPSGPPARVAYGVVALPRGAQVEIDAVVALAD